MAEYTQESPMVTIGVPKERAAAETRVALVPDVVRRIVAEGIAVLVEHGAGNGSSVPDRLYQEAGAEIVSGPNEIYDRATIIAKVRGPAAYPDIDEIGALKRGQVLVAFLAPLVDHDLVRSLCDAGVEAFSMDSIPRTTRAQSMDALSSQSNLAGYKSVILAADALGKIFPLMMTAAGTITPARVLVLGAGVAGLQAIGTAKRLGAVVYGYDVRAVVREQVESLGGRFVELDLGEDLAGAGGYAKQASEDQTRLQQEGLAKEAALADVVITTALIPGKPAPLLITADAVSGMKPGSVIVDLAGEMGGNCELSQPGETVVEHDVTIMAPLNIPGLVPVNASQVYARNIQSFIGLLVKNGRLDVNFDDDIVAGTAIVHDGEVVHSLTRRLMGLPDPEEDVAPATLEGPEATEEPTAEPEPSDGLPASTAASPTEFEQFAAIDDVDEANPAQGEADEASTVWPAADAPVDESVPPEPPEAEDDYPRPTTSDEDQPSRRDTESGGSA